MRSLDVYLALHAESEELDNKIDTISSDIQQTTSLYYNRRLDMCHYIDRAAESTQQSSFRPESEPS
jgi:hypothetical protein